MHGHMNVKILADSASRLVTKFLYCGSRFQCEFDVMQPTDESWSRSQVALKQVCTTDGAMT